jgi:hypothetical protein
MAILKTLVISVSARPSSWPASMVSAPASSSCCCCCSTNIRQKQPWPPASCLAFYFFFGALHDFLKAHLRPAFEVCYIWYRFLLTAVAWGLFPAAYKPFFSTVVLLPEQPLPPIYRHCRQGRSPPRLRPTIPTAIAPPHPIHTITYTRYTDTAKPDIYFLLFDAYTSSLALKEQYHYDNGDFDRFLLQKGFHIQREPQQLQIHHPFHAFHPQYGAIWTN